MSKTAKPFTMVRRSLWGSVKFTSLSSDKARYLYLYLLTCPHQTSSGCLLLKPAYALADLGMTGSEWSLQTLKGALAVLEEAGLILSDETASEILIAGWWKDNAPSNASWFVGAMRQTDAISSDKLKTAAQEALRECWEAFKAAEALKAEAAKAEGKQPTQIHPNVVLLMSRLGRAA